MIKKTFQYNSTGTSYNMKILLTCSTVDYGFFDTYEDFDEGELFDSVYIVTGITSSRLEELRKYSTSTDYAIKYVTSTDSGVNGVDLSLSIVNQIPKVIVYYIDNITYTNIEMSDDNISTSFYFVSTGFSTHNFENKPIIKLESKENVVENPVIESDVFIVRQEIPVFEKCIRLRAINDLSQIISYAGGNYFKIYENT